MSDDLNPNPSAEDQALSADAPTSEAPAAVDAPAPDAAAEPQPEQASAAPPDQVANRPLDPLPTFKDGDVPRAQALPELGDEFEGEVRRPNFEAPGFEFFMGADGMTTYRVVCVGNDFFKVKHDV